MWFWIFHLTAESIACNASYLGDKLAATELKMSQPTQYNSDACGLCVSCAGALIYALEILGSLLQFTYCNQAYKWKTAGPAIFWKANKKNAAVIFQSSINPRDVKIEIQNNASLSSFIQQGKLNNDRGLRVVMHSFQFGLSRFTGQIMF